VWVLQGAGGWQQCVLRMRTRMRTEQRVWHGQTRLLLLLTAVGSSTRPLCTTPWLSKKCTFFVGRSKTPTTQRAYQGARVAVWAVLGGRCRSRVT